MRYLSIPAPSSNILSIENFDNIKSRFIFMPKDCRNYSIISPYIMLTNGQECIIYENQHNEVEVGLQYLVQQIKNQPEEVCCNSLIDGSIMYSSLKQFFSEIKTRSDSQKSNGPDIPDGEDIDILYSNVKIKNTKKAIYSLDKKKLYIIYLVLFNSEKSAKFIPAEGFPSIISSPINALINMNVTQSLFSFIAKTTLTLLGTGEIIIPIS